MSDATTRPSPRATSVSLIRTTALAEAAHRSQGEEGLPPADFKMYRALTATLEAWQSADTLREDSLILVEWLATEWCGYRLQQLGQDQSRLEHWLREFGDQACQQQRHAHSAGPTAMEVMTIVAAPRAGISAADHANRLAIPYLGYLRREHELEDARELALAFALWAGGSLSELMLHDATRIRNYTDARSR